MTVWLERLGIGFPFERLGAVSGVTELSTLLGKLNRTRYGADAGEALEGVSFIELSSLLKRVRTGFLRVHRKTSAHQPLPPLNPIPNR